MVRPQTSEAVIATRQGKKLVTASPQVFDLLRDDVATSVADTLENSSAIPLDERPIMIVCVDGTPRHIKVI